MMGVFDGDGDYVEGSVLDRRFGDLGIPMVKELLPEVVDADEPGIFLGSLFHRHFGHFLLESLARAWYARDHPGVPLIWSGEQTWPEVELWQWQIDMLRVLGIEAPARIVTRPTRFTVLHVPEIGFRYDDRLHPEHAAFLGNYEGPRQIPGHRLWLSRSKWGSDPNRNEPTMLERRLSHGGWTVAHPESLSLRQQLDHLSRAEIIAGEEGSALHSLVLLKDIKDKQFHVLRRRGPEHGTFRTLGDARQVNQTFYTVKSERVTAMQGRAVSKINPNSSEVLDILRVPVGPAVYPASRSSEVRVLTKAIKALGPRSYLEIGCDAPLVVVESKVPVSVAVCPRFGFDPRAFPDAGVAFYELDLAAYAANFREEGQTFDLIRIAGSRFERIVAAFEESKQLSHASTKWLLGLGGVASRVALAAAFAHPGYTAKRLTVQGQAVYFIERTSKEVAREARQSGPTFGRAWARIPRLQPLCGT